jgi:hypothetical protein
VTNALLRATLAAWTPAPRSSMGASGAAEPSAPTGTAAAVAAAPAAIIEPPAASIDEVLLAHTRPYAEGYIAGTLPPDHHKRIGFPWSPAFAERTLRITGGTLAATADALAVCRRPSDAAEPQTDSSGSGWGAHAGSSSSSTGRRSRFVGPGGVACNQAGGTHHAFPDRGEGFCIFNGGWCRVPVPRAGAGARRCGAVPCRDRGLLQHSFSHACPAAGPSCASAILPAAGPACPAQPCPRVTNFSSRSSYRPRRHCRRGAVGAGAVCHDRRGARRCH